MVEEKEKTEMNKALFVNLGIMLSTSAMQQLGKLINPMTGKTEVNLEAAQATIDLLEMLQAKTEGNLDKDEERFLKNTLATLQMNYVETAQSAPAAEPEKKESKPEPHKQDATPREPGSEAQKKDEEPPRFHKSYG